MSFTPGPWIVGMEDGVTCAVAERNPGYHVVMGRCPPFVFGACVAVVDGVANASAIAAVPDLIVALEQCKRQSAFLMENLTRDARVVAMQINAVASAALAKAKGTE